METRPSMEVVLLSSGQKLKAHAKWRCDGPCPIHSPSDHHMITWNLVWRDDLYLFERICEHGIGHPDPDSLAYLKKVNPDSDSLAIHGCDNCCVPPQDTAVKS